MAAGSCKEREAPGAGSSKPKAQRATARKGGKPCPREPSREDSSDRVETQRATTYGPQRGTPRGCHLKGAPTNPTKALNRLRSRVRSRALRTPQRQGLTKALRARQMLLLLLLGRPFSVCARCIQRTSRQRKHFQTQLSKIAVFIAGGYTLLSLSDMGHICPGLVHICSEPVHICS